MGFEAQLVGFGSYNGDGADNYDELEQGYEDME
jgi:hypothetical protein